MRFEFKGKDTHLQKLITFSLFLFLITFITQSNAATYYIDSEIGNDLNNGISILSPLRTIAALSLKNLTPGDAVLFKRGSVWKEQFNINYSGSESQPIVISAYGTGTSPVIDAELIRSNGIYLSGRNNIIIKNLNIINQGGNGGIRIRYAVNVKVDSCSFYITGQGGVFIENSTRCTISNSVFRTSSDSMNVQCDGIYSQRNSFITFDRNDILITNQNPDQHDDGIQSYLDTSLTICNNKIEQRNNKTGNAQGIYITTGSGVFTIFNNIINCPNALSHTVGFRNLATGTGVVRVYNNTLINKGANALRISETGDVVVKNNILISKSSNASMYLDNTIINPSNINYNLYCNNGSSNVVYYVPSGGYKTLTQWQAMGFDINSQLSNPMLNSDFSLTQFSPAVDAGLDLGNLCSYDIIGTERPQQNACDIGAYEFASNSVLPVELSYFTAELKDNVVILNWTTSSETNNFGFLVERRNGSLWEEIGFVKGQGNCNISTSYNYNDKVLPAKSTTYRLKQIDINGTFVYSKELDVVLIAKSYFISQNYPNPFNPSTRMEYYLPSAGLVNISIFNIAGEKVTELVNSEKMSGTYEINWNASGFSSGIYFMKMTVQGDNGNLLFANSRKLNLIK